MTMTNHHQPDFYLASGDVYPNDDLAKPRKGWSVKHLKGDVRDDYLLVRLDPPIMGQPLGLEKDLGMVLVVTKDRTASLFPPRRWPVLVYVLRLLIDDAENRESIHDNEFALLVWA